MTQSRFKRLPVGANFSHDGTNYRKRSDTTAVRLHPNGRGNTARPVLFCKNTFVSHEPNQ